MYRSNANNKWFSFVITPTKFVLTGTCFIFLTACGEGDAVDERNEAENDTINELSSDSTNDVELALGGLPQVQIPDDYELLSEVVGDLDGDDIAEKVVVFNTSREGDMGTERELRIYSNHDGLWSLWHTAVGPILSSESGGTMGDPFEKVEIRKGMIEVFHFGGSADKWSYAHSFKLNKGEWELAGATLSFFKICDYSETYTYDLTNGTGYHSKHTEACNADGQKLESILLLEEVLNIDNKQPKPLLEEFIPGATRVFLLNSDEPYFY